MEPRLRKDLPEAPLPVLQLPDKPQGDGRSSLSRGGIFIAHTKFFCFFVSAENLGVPEVRYDLRKHGVAAVDAGGVENIVAAQSYSPCSIS